MIRTAPCLLLLVLVPLSAAACAPDPSTLPDLAIENVTVVDAVAGVRADRTVVVDDGRIVAVQDAGSQATAADVVDGTGRFVVPGLWDFHVHLTYDERFTEAMPALFLRHGITSIRDTGGMLDRVLPVVERMRAPGAVAPRVHFAGPLMDGEHVVYDGVNRPALGIANPTPDSARANVAGLVEAGVDFLKIYELVSPEVFEALVEAAGEHGLPIDGHVPLSMRARDVGPRVRSLEHLRNLELDCASDAEALLEARREILSSWDEGPGAELRSRLHSLQRLPAVAAYDEATCQEMLESMSATIQVPTLRLNALGVAPPFERRDWDEAVARVPEPARAEWTTVGAQAGEAPQRDTTFGAWSLFLTGEAHAAGVPFAAGTDTPIGFAIPGWSLHNELAMLVRAGLSPRDALHAATVRPAEFFGLEEEMGQVAEGFVADLVILEANPLEDITNTRSITGVVTKGDLYSLPRLDSLVATAGGG